jgi:hypothetical protein
MPDPLRVQPITFHLEQPTQFKLQGGTYFNMPERTFCLQEKRQVQGITKKHKDMYYAWTHNHRICTPLTSFPTRNTMCNNINSVGKHKYNTDITNT